MKKYHISGQLTISETNSINNRMNYIIKENSTQQSTSITNILDNIFNGKNINNKLVRIIARTDNSNNSEFNGMGNLHLCRDNSLIEGYCVGSRQLENWLFDNVDNSCEVYLEDYTNFVFTEATISNDKAKSIS